MRHRDNSARAIARRFTDQVSAGLQRVSAGNGRIVVAASGGPDSTALLVALHALRRTHKLELAMAHANHALRAQASDQDEQFVRDLCTRLAIECFCKRLPVALDAVERDEGIEATARELRLNFLRETASQWNATFVATGHTADDQAETVLHRILRGTGLAGLSGIPPIRSLTPEIQLIRPLLNIRRGEIRDYLSALGQDFREDQSNLDVQFTRNRLRHHVLPYVAEHINPQIVEAIQRLATLARDAQAVIDSQVDRLMRRARISRESNRVAWNVNVLRRAPRYLLSEALRRLWSEQSWPQQELGNSDLTRIAELVAASKKHDACHLPGGIVARRSGDRLLIERMTG